MLRGTTSACKGRKKGIGIRVPNTRSGVLEEKRGGEKRKSTANGGERLRKGDLRHLAHRGSKTPWSVPLGGGEEKAEHLAAPGKIKKGRNILMDSSSGATSAGEASGRSVN